MCFKMSKRLGQLAPRPGRSNTGETNRGVGGAVVREDDLTDKRLLSQ